MGNRIIRGIEWLLLDFEERMVTFMIWLCWILGITTDEVERYREMERAGLTDLALRVFEDPMEGLQTIKEHVIPHFS